MYILADIKCNCKKSRFYRNKDDDFKKITLKNFLYFDVYDFIFSKYICEMYISANVK